MHFVTQRCMGGGVLHVHVVGMQINMQTERMCSESVLTSGEEKAVRSKGAPI